MKSVIVTYYFISILYYIIHSVNYFSYYFNNITVMRLVNNALVLCYVIIMLVNGALVLILTIC